MHQQNFSIRIPQHKLSGAVDEIENRLFTGHFIKQHTFNQLPVKWAWEILTILKGKMLICVELS